MSITDTRYLTIAEAAPILRITKEELRDRCRNGEIEAFKPGHAWLLSEHTLTAYIEAHSNQKDVA